MADHMFVRPGGQGSWTLVCSVRCIDRLIDMEDNGGKRSDFESCKLQGLVEVLEVCHGGAQLPVFELAELRSAASLSPLHHRAACDP